LSFGGRLVFGFAERSRLQIQNFWIKPHLTRVSWHYWAG